MRTTATAGRLNELRSTPTRRNDMSPITLDRTGHGTAPVQESDAGFSPLDALIDAVTGDSRADLVGRSPLEVYEHLCNQIRAMGCVPAAGKVMRIAQWISAGDSDDQHAA
jgi:hypothetical protein